MHSFAATLKSHPSGTSAWPAAWRCREGDTVTASQGPVCCNVVGTRQELSTVQVAWLDSRLARDFNSVAAD